MFWRQTAQYLGRRIEVLWHRSAGKAEELLAHQANEVFVHLRLVKYGQPFRWRTHVRDLGRVRIGVAVVYGRKAIQEAVERCLLSLVVSVVGRVSLYANGTMNP